MPTSFRSKTCESFVSRTVFPMKIEVVAYSGYKANERPLYFVLEQNKLGVVNVVDRWYGVEHDYFKVLAEDGKGLLGSLAEAPGFVVCREDNGEDRKPLAQESSGTLKNTFYAS